MRPGTDAFTAKQAWGLPMWHPNSSSWEQSSWETKPLAHHLVNSCHLPNSKENGSEAWSLPCTLSAWREANTFAHVQHVPWAHQSHQGFATGEKLGHRGEGRHSHGGGHLGCRTFTPSTVGSTQAVEDVWICLQCFGAPCSRPGHHHSSPLYSGPGGWPLCTSLWLQVWVAGPKESIPGTCEGGGQGGAEEYRLLAHSLLPPGLAWLNPSSKAPSSANSLKAAALTNSRNSPSLVP